MLLSAWSETMAEESDSDRKSEVKKRDMEELQELNAKHELDFAKNLHIFEGEVSFDNLVSFPLINFFPPILLHFFFLSQN